jgi:hypothetical protein
MPPPPLPHTYNTLWIWSDFAAGSSTGELKLWRITPDKKLEEAMVIPTVRLQYSKCGRKSVRFVRSLRE